jgi:hypothetical protein
MSRLSRKCESLYVYRPPRRVTGRGLPSVHLDSQLFQYAVGIRRFDRFCGLVIRVLGYRSGGPGSIPGTTRKKKVVGLERGALSLVSTN